MEDHAVVPDLIDVVPPYIIKIKYENESVNLGNELTPTQVKNSPTTISYPAEDDILYTLCMIDPDAPSRTNPIRREVCHWLVINVPGNDISKGVSIYNYIGSGPPEGSGLHRYIFLVYKQTDKLNCDEMLRNNPAEQRGDFNTREFAKKYNLGEPIAGNFYQAQWDDYVPILWAQYFVSK